MAGPSITDSRCPLYENDLGIAILDPTLRKERRKLLCSGKAFIEYCRFGERPVLVVGPYAEHECHGCPFLTAFGIWDVRVPVLRDIAQCLVKGVRETFWVPGRLHKGYLNSIYVIREVILTS
jgi:hypothetical protein